MSDWDTREPQGMAQAIATLCPVGLGVAIGAIGHLVPGIAELCLRNARHVGKTRAMQLADFEMQAYLRAGGKAEEAEVVFDLDDHGNPTYVGVHKLWLIMSPSERFAAACERVLPDDVERTITETDETTGPCGTAGGFLLLVKVSLGYPESRSWYAWISTEFLEWSGEGSVCEQLRRHLADALEAHRATRHRRLRDL